MSYEPTVWQTGDTVTAEKMNKLEQGVANAGGILVLHWDSETNYLDKTAVEIVQFAQTGIVYLPMYSSGEEGLGYVYYTLSRCVIENESEYTLDFLDPFSDGNNLSFWAENGTDYPVLD